MAGLEYGGFSGLELWWAWNRAGLCSVLSIFPFFPQPDLRGPKYEPKMWDPPCQLSRRFHTKAIISITGKAGGAYPFLRLAERQRRRGRGIRQRGRWERRRRTGRGGPGGACGCGHSGRETDRPDQGPKSTPGGRCGVVKDGVMTAGNRQRPVSEWIEGTIKTATTGVGRERWAGRRNEVAKRGAKYPRRSALVSRAPRPGHRAGA